MARPGAFKSEKRKKELTRQKKQEKKRQRRLEKDTAPRGDTTEIVPGEVTAEGVATEKQDEPKVIEDKESL